MQARADFRDQKFCAAATGSGESVGSADKAFLSAFFDLYGREATVYNALGFEAANAALSAFYAAGEKNLKADEMHFKKLTEDYYKDLIVVSYNEVESNVELQSVGMVTA